VSDDWMFLGQIVEAIDRGQAQRTWLLGTATKRPAMILQFSIAGSGFQTTYPFGVRQQANLVYWPGAVPQRAMIEARNGDMVPFTAALPGYPTIDEFYTSVAALLARQPWQERFLCVLNNVIPLYDQGSDQWWVRDVDGQGLPLVRGEYWQLLVYSGGRPVDFAGEWNGETVTPLGVWIEGQYHKI
jgi:hypothetical protein